MKTTVLLFTALFLSSCYPTSYTGSSNSKMISDMNSKIAANVKTTMGSTKQNIVMNWGPPTSTTTDGTEKGEIYSYIRSQQFSFGLYTSFVYLYFNENNVVYFTNFKYTLQ